MGKKRVYPLAVGKIRNYYGKLLVKRDTKNQTWWGIESYDGIQWEAIPETLYIALVEFEKARVLRGDDAEET